MPLNILWHTGKPHSPTVIQQPMSDDISVGARGAEKVGHIDNWTKNFPPEGEINDKGVFLTHGRHCRAISVARLQ